MNLPQALLDSLSQVPGFDAADFIAAHELPAPISVRLHPVKGQGLLTDQPTIPWCPQGHYLSQRPVFTIDPLFHAGAYYVQEASSMILDYLWRNVMAGREGLRVLDLCAAPGGKSTLLASLLDEQSLLISNDVIRSRATILDESMTRWGYTNTWVTSNDPRDFGRMPGYFDAIVVDAPCSGSGLFRKDPKALLEWSEEAVTQCASRQQRILADVWPALKEGGVLFYATCSYSAAEDEGILEWLNAEFELETISCELPVAWGIQEVRANSAPLKGYRCFPAKVRGEGFFIAMLRKTETAPPFYYPRFRAASLKKAVHAAEYLLKSQSFSILEDERRMAFALKAVHEPDYHFLREIVYLRKAGIRLGQAAQKDWIPEHDVALSLDKNPALPTWALSKEEALNFLKKEELPVPAISSGWYIVSYEGRGLGWVKVMKNRINNYLPKNWRIRMDIPEDLSNFWES